MSEIHPLLSEVQVGALRLRNRVVVAPMSRVSTAGDGVATPAMARYYAEFATGGFGLIVSEGTYTDFAHSQAYSNQPGIGSDRQASAWARVTEAVRSAGGRIFLQLMHAGALVQGNSHRTKAIAPSAVEPLGTMLGAGYGGDGPFAIPVAMTGAHLGEAIEGFAAAARRAELAGFDGVEIHAANGYLIDQFLTKYTNLRDDEFGGSVENRARFLREVVGEIRRSVSAAFPIGIRISQVKVNDPDFRWSGIAEARQILGQVASCHAAYVHVSSEDAAWGEVSFLAPDVSVTALARSVCGVPVIANGGLDEPRLASRLLQEGHADLISIGHGAVANPDWPNRLREGVDLAPYERAMLRPEVTLGNTSRWRAARGVGTAGRGCDNVVPIRDAISSHE